MKASQNKPSGVRPREIYFLFLWALPHFSGFFSYTTFAVLSSDTNPIYQGIGEGRVYWRVCLFWYRFFVLNEHFDFSAATDLNKLTNFWGSSEYYMISLLPSYTQHRTFIKLVYPPLWPKRFTDYWKLNTSPAVNCPFSALNAWVLTMSSWCGDTPIKKPSLRRKWSM